jgi:hypothetical protein
MKPSVTWRPQVEKRLIIPTIQSVIVGLSAGSFYYSITTPLHDAISISLGVTTVFLARLYFFQNPQPKQLNNKTYESNSKPVYAVSRTEPVVKEPGRPLDSWPVDLKDLKFYCWMVGYKGESLSLNVWTKNSSGGREELKIFSKKDYGTLISQMLKYGYVNLKKPGSPNLGYKLTDLGFSWSRKMVSSAVCPTLEEFAKNKYNILPVISTHSTPAHSNFTN